MRPRNQARLTKIWAKPLSKNRNIPLLVEVAQKRLCWLALRISFSTTSRGRNIFKQKRTAELLLFTGKRLNWLASMSSISPRALTGPFKKGKNGCLHSWLATSNSLGWGKESDKHLSKVLRLCRKSLKTTAISNSVLSVLSPASLKYCGFPVG